MSICIKGNVHKMVLHVLFDLVDFLFVLVYLTAQFYVLLEELLDFF